MSFNECAAALSQKITKTVVDGYIGNIAPPMIAKHLAPSPKVRVFAPDAAFRHYEVIRLPLSLADRGTRCNTNPPPPPSTFNIFSLILSSPE